MMVTIASYSFPHEAQIARACLGNAGIPAEVVDEHTVNMQWLYSVALGGVKVRVPSTMAQEASRIINSDFSSEVESEFGIKPTVCPDCGASCPIPYSKGKNPAFIVFLLLGFPLFFVKHGLKCNECGNFWQP